MSTRYTNDNVNMAVTNGIAFLAEQPKLLCVFTANADGQINFDRSRGDGGALMLTDAMGVKEGSNAQRACDRLFHDAALIGRPVVRKQIGGNRIAITIGVKPAL